MITLFSEPVCIVMILGKVRHEQQLKIFLLFKGGKLRSSILIKARVGIVLLLWLVLCLLGIFRPVNPFWSFTQCTLHLRHLSLTCGLQFLNYGRICKCLIHHAPTAVSPGVGVVHPLTLLCARLKPEFSLTRFRASPRVRPALLVPPEFHQSPPAKTLPQPPIGSHF